MHPVVPRVLLLPMHGFQNHTPRMGQEMKDSEFLGWLHDRLVYVYNESPNLDFVQKVSKIAGRVDDLTRQLEDARRIATASGYFQDHRGEDYDLDSDNGNPEWRADPVGPVAWDRQVQQR